MAVRNPITPRAETPAKSTLSLQEQIQQRAHEIYLQRGDADGSALDDWLEAEAEIRQLDQDDLLKSE